MFLKSEGVKSNDENIMKSNDGIPSHHENFMFLSMIL